jgi:AraC-like DNA-binding protein
MDNCTGIGEAAAIFEAMFRAFREGDTMRDAALGCHLERLLLTLAEDRRTPSTKPCAILRSLEYIDSHYTEVFPITALSRMEGLSYSRYHDVFVAEMGVSPRRYITRLRLRHACELLCGTDMSIAQIGMQVGYDDPSFFSKLFKKEIGISPLRYREQNSESAHDRPRGRSCDGSLSPIE